MTGKFCLIPEHKVPVSGPATDSTIQDEETVGVGTLRAPEGQIAKCKWILGKRG
jgi:hypothetical protein